MRLLCLLLVAGAALAVPTQEYLPSLEGAKVFRVIAKTEEELSAILAFRERDGYEVLKYGHVLGDEIQMLVTADYVESFEAFLVERDIGNSIVTANVQKAVDEEATRQRNVSATRTTGRVIFETYPRYDTVRPKLLVFEVSQQQPELLIVEFVRQVASDHSDIATLINFGLSEEGREIYGLKISSGGTGKPAVLIEGTLHAREWIVPSTLLYFINELVEDAGNADLFSNVDWYFIPVLNPDGYEFSHTSYRLWRKTRKNNPGSSCRGVDGNRNFDFQWMVTGASSNRCSDIFAGPEPFSEVETQILRDFVLANSDTIKLYLSYHSWGNYFLWPWGHTVDLPDNDDELRALAQAADDAQATLRGTRYTMGTISNVLYSATGGSVCWVKAVGGVELAFVIELPGAGWFGFDIPASEIIPVGQESFLALRVFGEYVATKFAGSK